MDKVKGKVKKMSQKDSFVGYKGENVGLKQYYAPVMMALLVVASFFLGRLSLEVTYLKNGQGTQAKAVGDSVVPTPEPARKLDVPSLKVHAKNLGLDSGTFDTCLDGGKYAQQVADEASFGQGLGVSGTPTFFINGLMIVGAQPQTSFEAIIDAELKNGGGAAEAKKLGEDGARKKITYGNGYVTGAKDAKIKIMEFTDFECPFCERAFPTIQALMQKYEGKISLEYRSYPLPFHPLAQKAAEAALCAGDQGKFWEMHDKLFIPEN